MIAIQTESKHVIAHVEDIKQAYGYLANMKSMGISTQRLSIADLNATDYGTYKTIDHDQRPHRGRRKGSKNANRSGGV